MADPFVLRWKVDRPFIEAGKAEDVYALVTIEPNPSVLGQAGSANLPVHTLLLVDVSGSMDFLVRHDPNAQSLGEGVTEGRQAQNVLSDVPSRREMAGTVVQRLAQRLQANDLLTVVAFDDMGFLLAEGVNPMSTEGLADALLKLSQVGGGGTQLSQGLEVVRLVLSRVNDAPRTRRLVLLTDGEDEKPAEALEAARKLAQEFNLPIVALGTGECKVAFLTDVAKTTLAGAFNHIQHENEADQFFHQALAGQKNVQATNVTFKLWLSPDLQVRELYRTRPEILFVGDLQPDEQNQVVLRLEQMERGKAYEFLFRCTLPARAANQRLRIAKATLSYDLPALGLFSQNVETNVVATYTGDAHQARERSGDVRRVLTRAEVQRQVLFLQTKIDALKRGKAGDRDATIVANLLQALVKKFEEFGDQAMVNQYRAMQTEFTEKGVISQEMLNRSLAASSRAEEMIVAQDIDF
jgi:hypothetical protein